jgi:8-oxo-dGTP pyrophosphatase MutT (NUDIX family)
VSFAQALGDVLLDVGSHEQPQSDEQVAAAVLVPLYEDGAGELRVVLTKRRADLRRHAGEISFPGGRHDPGDASLSDTALREAEEEIGLDPAQVTSLGELPSVSTFATGYLIHPFAGAIPAGVAWRLSAREVDAVIELPLESLRAGRTRTQMERRGFTFETDAFIVGEHLIWGATARIIDLLLGRLDVCADGELALAPADEPG